MVSAGRVDVWTARGYTPHVSDLEAMIAGYLDCPVHAVVLSRDARGKPFVAGPVLEGIQFNLSRSAGITLLAVTRSLKVGVDVEALRPITHLTETARRFFTSAEQELLAECTDRERLRLFLSIWTRMEARLKASGDGIYSSEGASRFRESERETDGFWMTYPLSVGPEFVATLVIAGPVDCIDYRQWSDNDARTDV